MKSMTSLLLLLLLLLGVLNSINGVVPSTDSRLLTAYPFILSHDSATGEIDTSRDGIIKDIVDVHNIIINSFKSI